MNRKSFEFAIELFKVLFKTSAADFSQNLNIVDAFRRMYNRQVRKVLVKEKTESIFWYLDHSPLSLN